MDLASKPVLFRLSSEGRRALKGLVTGKASFQALVVGADAIGAWILMGSTKGVQLDQSMPVMLLKWNYIATAAFEFRPETPPARIHPGFVQG